MQKELFNPNRSVKAMITFCDDGSYRVELFRLVKEVVPEFHYESDYYWEPTSWAYIADSFENAEKLAIEELKAYPD